MRQLIFALDACEWDLVRRWAAEGKLPAFRRLLDEGASGTLATTAVQLPDTIWSCIYGGRNPGTFEKYFYVQYDARTGDLRHVHDDGFTQRPFWDILSDGGKKVGVVDLVKLPTSRRLNGFQLTNWGAHATKAEKASIPPDLLATIESRFGYHPVGDCDKVDASPRSQLDLRRRCIAGVRLRGDVMRWLAEEHEWDVFVAGISESHCIGHHFWHWLDPRHPRHGEGDPFGLADSIEQVYRAIDAEMGRMIDLAGDDALVMAVSGHGMGPLYHASWNLPEILDLLGYGREPAGTAMSARVASTNPWRILKMVLPGKLQYFIKGLLPRRLQDEILFRWYAGRRDWKGRRAFAVPNNDSVGAIRVNVKGRDRHGVVAPDDYDRVCNEIATALGELVDPVTGRKVIARLTRSSEEFSGKFLHGLPDLTVSWDTSFPWHAVRSPRFGTLALTKQDGRTGSHTDHGFVIVRGPGVPAGRELTGCSLYDIAPTILAAAGIAAPADMEGRPLPIFAGSTVRGTSNGSAHIDGRAS